MDPAAAVLAVWLPIVVGLTTVVLAVYGALRTWDDRRRERRARLADTARIAVRVTEAAYVRPLLRRRLEDSVRRYLGADRPRGGGQHPYATRLLLFCQLQDDVGLTGPEKLEARTRAFNQLVDLLRAMPRPPVRLHSDEALCAARPCLEGALEVAYNLCPRPANALIADLGAFAGRVAAGGGGGAAAE